MEDDGGPWVARDDDEFERRVEEMPPTFDDIFTRYHGPIHAYLLGMARDCRFPLPVPDRQRRAHGWPLERQRHAA